MYEWMTVRSDIGTPNDLMTPTACEQAVTYSAGLPHTLEHL